MELPHLEQVSGSHIFVGLQDIFLRNMMMGQSRSLGVPSGETKAHRLLGLSENVILLSDHLGRYIPVIIRYNVSNGCTRSVRSTVEVLLFRQVDSAIRNLGLQPGHRFSERLSEGALGSSGCGLAFERHLVRLFEILFISWLFAQMMVRPFRCH